MAGVRLTVLAALPAMAAAQCPTAWATILDGSSSITAANF
eukprot:gene2720-3367_t